MTRTQWFDLIRPGALSNAAFLLLGVVLWGDFAHQGLEAPPASASYAFNYVAQWAQLSPLASKSLDLVLSLTVAFFIMRLNEAHQFIRVRTFLPSALCILLGGLLLPPHYLTSGSIVACLLFASVAQALELANTHSQKQTFNIGLLLGLAAMVYPFSLLYLLVFFYFYYNFNVLSLRSALATLTGAALPLCYGSVAIWATGKQDLFSSYFRPENTHVQVWLPHFGEAQLAYVAVLGVVLLAALAYVWMTYQKEALKPRRMFSFFVQLLLFTLALMLFSRSGFSNLLYTLIFLSSIVVGRVFSTTVPESKASLWSFRLLLLTSAAYGAYTLFVA